MDWARPIDLYCERTDASFWAEPVNAISNLAFLIAAGFAYAHWRRTGERDTSTLLLIVLVFAIGVGSFIFHTVATLGSELFDVVPITVFIYGYLVLALRRFLSASWTVVAGMLAAFIGVSYADAALVPADTLNGSHEYLPALAAMLLVGLAVWRRPSGPPIVAAAATFLVSVAFRSIDNAVCPLLPLGTHFLWHGLNACVLYLLLRAAMADPGRKPRSAG
jgi:hypothetical protein